MKTCLICLALLGFLECLPTQCKAASTNVVARRCWNAQEFDYLEYIVRGQKSNRELASRYVKLAQGNPRHTHYAISMQGTLPAVENLGFLCSFTNSPKHATAAVSSIVRILGVSSEAMQIADRAISMKTVPGRDKLAICRAIAEMASKSNVLLDDRLFARDLLRSYEAEVEGASHYADEICLESSNMVRNVKIERRTVDSVPDEKIRNAFLVASDPAYCGSFHSLAYEHAVKLCGVDRRRRVRIVVDIAQEYPDRVPWVLSELSVCGTREDVPFVCGWTNDVRNVANAAHALICIEGVASNTIECADMALSMANIGRMKCYALCSAIARMAKRSGASEENRKLGVSALKRYSRTIPATALWADEFLLSLDPAYEASDDRKALLREVAERRVNDYQIDYATNALKRIDAKVQTKKEER